MIAETMDFHVAILKIHALQFLVHKVGDIGTPGETIETGVWTDSVMISCNNHHMNQGDRAKEIV